MKSESAEGTSGATDGPCQDALVLEDTEEDLSSSESSCDYEDTGELKDKRRRKRRRRRRDSSGSVWSSGDLGSDALRNRNDSPPSTSGGGRAEKESESEEKEGGRRSEEKEEEDALGDADRTAKEKRVESDSAAKEKCRRKEAKKNRTEGDGEATLFLRRSCPPATSESPPPPPRLPARPRRPRGTHASRHSCKQGSATPVNSSGSADIGRDGSKASSSRWLGRRGIPTTAKLYLVLAATSLVVYVNGVVGDYVHDDLSAVVGNPDVQGTTPLWRLLVNDFWGRPMADPASHKSYRPLTILSFRFTHWLWSHSALVDHLVNIALHVGVTVLYARTLLSALRLSLAQTLISGLAFATHPVHTEAVTGIVGRADLLAAVAFLSSFNSYHRAMQPDTSNREGLWLCWAGIWACVGVLCKEHALMVLGVCVVWDLVYTSPSIKQHVWDRTGLNTVMPLSRRIARMMLLGLSVVFLRLLLMRAAPVFSDQDNPASFAKSRFTRFLTFSYLPAHNAWLLLCPASLSYDWQIGAVPLVASVCDMRNLGSLLLYGGLVFVAKSAYKCREREGRAILWSLLVLCLPFLPASNLLFRVGFVVAERLLYIPSLGWCTLLGVGAVRVASLVPEKILRRLLLALLLTWCLKTARRNLDWWSREALFVSGVNTLPHNAKMHYNVANLYKDKENHANAVRHYEEAIRLWWLYPSAHNNLGTILMQQGKYQEAEWHFSVALQSHPEHFPAARNLASLWVQQGRTDQAISLLESVFAPEEEKAGEAGVLLAGLYLQQGKVKEAEGVHLSLTAAQPSQPSILADYAAFLHRLGRNEAAVRHYEAALSLDHAHTRALKGYAALMSARDHHARAHELYTRALDREWDPDTATALAKVCILTGRLEQAHALLDRVTLLHPKHLAARVHLAQVKLQQRQYTSSEAILQEVLAEAPTHREALYHLSLVYSVTNRSDEAVGAATVAARACSDPRELCALLHAHHADLLHTLSLMEAAAMSYQIAVSLEPSLTRAHLNLGAIHHTQGRYHQALDHYRTALAQDPTNSLILENMEKLHRLMNFPTRR